MRINRKKCLKERRLGKNSGFQGMKMKQLSCDGHGKIIRKFPTRSGYVTVRSIVDFSNDTKHTHDKTSPTKENGVKKKSKRSGETVLKSTPVVTVADSTVAVLNSTLCDSSFKKLLKKRWKVEKSFSSTTGNMVSLPFKVVTLHKLLSSEDYVEMLSKEVLSLSFDRVCNDLHDFKQTHDLFESPVNSPGLNSFLELLKGPLCDWMQEVTGKALSKKVTATASKYTFTNFLLCHDDNLSDRSIAFILYLSKDWKDTDGGALQLFECNEHDQPISIVQSILPVYGSLVFFEVTSKSYHQVQEILSKDKVRLSINGWFHGNQLPVKPDVVIRAPKFHPPISPKRCSFEKWVIPSYLNPSNHENIQSDFTSELAVSLPEFLHLNAYKDLSKALREESVVWEKCGPAHQKNYEQAKLSTLPSCMQEFLQLLKSKFMFYFLSEVTVDISPDSKTTPMWHLEVQRWSPGNYTLAVNNDPSSDITGIDVHLYFNVPEGIDSNQSSGGSVCYLGPDKDNQGFLEQNAEVEPENNALFLVAHITGMKRVTKYMNHRQDFHFHKIFAVYSQG